MKCKADDGRDPIKPAPRPELEEWLLNICCAVSSARVFMSNMFFLSSNKKTRALLIDIFIACYVTDLCKHHPH